MRSTLPRIFQLALISAFCCAAAVQGQTFEYKDGRKLQIEFVQEPPCPVKISVKTVDLKPDPDAQRITLQIENTSSTPIRAYAMISGGNAHPNVHTVTFPGDAFDPGKTGLRAVWPNSQEHYYFFFDYILFEDGSVCGLDNHRRSIQVKKSLNSWTAAVTRLKESTTDYSGSAELVAAIKKNAGADFTSFDNPGPPNPETIKSMPRLAYQHVMLQLLKMKDHREKAREIAEILQKEMPI